MTRGIVTALLAAACLIGAVAPADAAFLSRFTTGYPRDVEGGPIAPGPDGRVYFIVTSNDRPDQVGRIETGGRIQMLSLPSSGLLSGITATADGGVAVVGLILRTSLDDQTRVTYTRIDPATFTAGPVLALPSDQLPGTATLGPDGRVWAVASTGVLLRFRPEAGTADFVTAVRGTEPGVTIGGIATGPDNRLWYTVHRNLRQTPDAIGYLVSDGEVAEAPWESELPEVAGPLVRGPDGRMWQLLLNSDRLLHVGSDLKPAIASLPPGSVSGGVLTAEPEGQLWVGLRDLKLARFDPARRTGSQLSLVSPGENPQFGGLTSAGGYLWFTVKDRPFVGRVTLDSSPAGDRLTCAVPNLRGIRLAGARKRLSRARCASGRVTGARTKRQRSRYVVRAQSLAPGTRVLRGTRVDVRLGRKR